MVEFTRRTPPPAELLAYVQARSDSSPADFGSAAFHPVKLVVKRCLNEDQKGLCAYCESPLSPTSGQIDHVKPKSAHPDLTFDYGNYVHGCCHEPRHCGQKKTDKLLPIEPGPAGCNDSFILSTAGFIEPVSTLTRQKKHEARSTRDMLGLNHPALRVEREKWATACLKLFRSSAADYESFISDKPFRFILRRLGA